MPLRSEEEIARAFSLLVATTKTGPLPDFFKKSHRSQTLAALDALDWVMGEKNDDFEKNITLIEQDMNRLGIKMIGPQHSHAE